MEESKTVNPANAAAPVRKRVPMSVPQRKLETPEIPGHHLHWFVDRNIPRALQAGYEFVTDREVPINQFGVATDKSISGNADLGSQIRIVGGTAENGGVEYLTLMKLREEWWTEDRKDLEKRNASVLSAIFKDEQVIGSDKVSAEDRGQSYVKQALFNRPTRKAK